jgi:protein-L-isoaspartate O-methyltransferase
VLEVGTGSGLPFAVCLKWCARRIKSVRQEIVRYRTKNPSQLGYKPHFFFGDGYEGVLLWTFRQDICNRGGETFLKYYVVS